MATEIKATEIPSLKPYTAICYDSQSHYSTHATLDDAIAQAEKWGRRNGHYGRETAVVVFTGEPEHRCLFVFGGNR